jgi:hypothetical protein
MQIMLNGGVMTSIAMPRSIYKRLEDYTKGTFNVTDAADVPDADDIMMHAVFCYGWRNHPRYLDTGSWICKNR